MRTKITKIIIDFLYTLYKIIRIPIKWYWKIFKIQTKGVRVLLIQDNSIILVKHWYNPLIVMPGGGIKKYETPEQAAIREVKEELGFEIEQLEYLLGMYQNKREGKNDIIYCFVAYISSNKPILKHKFNFEIASIFISDIYNLPRGASKATCTRVREYLNGDISNNLRNW